MSSNKEEQDDELLALSEILDQSNFCHNVSDGGLNSGTMTVHVSNIGMTIIHRVEQLQIDHLPPLCLEFILPPQYPSDHDYAPSFTLSCPWLHTNHIDSLSNKLLEIHKDMEGAVVLFSWLSFLQEESLSFLGLDTSINIADLCDQIGVNECSSDVTDMENNHAEGPYNITTDKISDSQKTETKTFPPLHDFLNLQNFVEQLRNGSK